MSIVPEFIFNRYDNKVKVNGIKYRLCYLDPYEGTIGILRNGERQEIIGDDCEIEFKTICNILKDYKESKEFVRKSLKESLKAQRKSLKTNRKIGIIK